MKTLKANLALGKTSIWNLNAAHFMASESKVRHSCNKKTCHEQTCAFTCKNTCETCENTRCPGNTDKVCCA